MVSTAALSASARLGGVLVLDERSVGYRRLASRVEDRRGITVADATAGARAFAWSALVAQNARTVALVAPSEDRARRWRAELAGWLGEDRVLAFPERETMPFEASAPSGTAVHQRLLTLWRLATAQAPVAVVTSLRALLEHTIPPDELARRGRTLRAGDRLSWAETAAWLFDLGYEPVTEVNEPGTFSRRGGIIDIYPASAEQPARVELFGDEIETLRAFDPVTQRSQVSLEELIVLPAREFALEAAPALAERLNRAGWDRLAGADGGDGADLSPYGRLVDALREGGYTPGVDAFAPTLGAPRRPRRNRRGPRDRRGRARVRLACGRSRAARRRFRRTRARPARVHRCRGLRVPQAAAPGAPPQARPDRVISLRPEARRPRRARGPRHRPVRALHYPRGRRSGARVSRAAVRGHGRRLPSDRTGRQGDALRRRHAAGAFGPWRTRVGNQQTPSEEGRGGDREGATPPLRRARGHAGVRVRA